MTAYDGPAPDRAGVEGLFEASPALEAHTSVAATTAFVCGLGALLAAPFALTFAVALGLGLLGALAGTVAVVRTGRPLVAGRALAPTGLLFALVALAVLGLRYLNVDTAFGDAFGPALVELLELLNSEVNAPTPGAR